MFLNDKKLKIAIVTNNYKPYSGGVVSSIDSFKNQLEFLGHKVYIITLDFLGKKIEDQSNCYTVYCPIRFFYKNNHMAVPWQSDEYIYSFLKTLRPDIIHSQHPFLLGVSALKASRRLNIPIIFTYHTQYEKYSHYIPLPSSWTEPIIKKIALSYCNKVDAIIAPSKSTFNFLSNNNLLPPIRVISSGILPVFLPNHFKVKRNNPFHLITVSRFTKEKNIPFLLDVFSKLNCKNYIFTLIGYGIYLDYLKKYAYDKLKLSNETVKFIERPEKEIIADYYSLADLFLFSSLSETQGLVLAEAMAGSTPVIALNGPGSSDIIRDKINGFLVNSVDEMVQKIDLIYNDVVMHQYMQNNAFSTGLSYNPTNATEQLVDFYKSVLKR